MMRSFCIAVLLTLTTLLSPSAAFAGAASPRLSLGKPSTLGGIRGGGGRKGVGGGVLAMVGGMQERITQKLEQLNPTKLVVRDDSSKHAGHAGVGGRSGDTHFAVDIVSEAFEGKRLVQRHQQVYALLDEMMDKGGEGGIHALQISAKTPDEASK